MLLKHFEKNLFIWYFVHFRINNIIRQTSHSREICHERKLSLTCEISIIYTFLYMYTYEIKKWNVFIIYFYLWLKVYFLEYVLKAIKLKTSSQDKMYFLPSLFNMWFYSCDSCLISIKFCCIKMYRNKSVKPCRKGKLWLK